MDNLIVYCRDQTQAVFNRLRPLWEDLALLLGDDTTMPSFTVPTPPPGDRLNRAAYLWVIDVTLQLQSALNLLAGNVGANFSSDNGEALGAPVLWVPNRLVIDDEYWAKLKRNYQLANQYLDQLEQA